MKNYKGLKSSGILTIILGLFWTLTKNSYGPIIMALGIIFTAFFIFKDKKQNVMFSIIMAAALTGMLTLEYFLVPIQNTTFYLFLLIISLSIFITFYFSLKPQNLLTKGEKILSWTGSILFAVSLFGLMGIIFNNFRLSLLIGVFALIIFVIGRLIRRRLFKDNALKYEFNEDYTTRDPEKYWFKYEVGGMPKPVCWQGWVCYSIIFLSPFVVLIFDGDPTTAIVIAVAVIFVVTIIAILKSNYRESIREYREDLKK